MSVAPIAVVGAGIAGLACARTLFGAQFPVTVLEKSRGLGGRLATRRAGSLAFDHGAQYVVARERGFVDYVELASATGYAAIWTPQGRPASADSPWFVGTPGMSGFVKPLAAGLDIRCGVRVTACCREDDDWWLTTEPGDVLGPFAALVLAIPAPQALALMQASAVDVRIANRVAAVSMAPCWAALYAFADRVPGADVAVDPSPAIAWMARDSGKPGRPSTHDCWTVQASVGWTGDNLGIDASAAAAGLLRELVRAVGSVPGSPHAAAHLWRYARVETPLDEPCLWNPQLAFGVCGDWCLGARVEAAWRSGSALAQAMLADG